MTMKPLNFYQQGAVAGMQQDSYSQAPWFVESKNLDIFWSSQSVKATAWKEKEDRDPNIVEVDPSGRFELHKNCRVWDRNKERYITSERMHTWIIRKVKYNAHSVDMTVWSPIGLFVERGDSDRETIVVITTNLIYVKVNHNWKPKIKIRDIVGGKLNPDGSITWDGEKSYIDFKIDFDDIPWYATWASLLIKKELKDWDSEYGDLSIEKINEYQPSLSYDDRVDELTPDTVFLVDSIATGRVSPSKWVPGNNSNIEILNPWLYPQGVSESWSIRVRAKIVNQSNPKQFEGKITVEMIEGINSYTNFIAKIRDEKIKKEWDRYIMNGYVRSKIYQFSKEYNTDWSIKRVDFLKGQDLEPYMWLEVADVVTSDTQVFMFGNKKGDGIISRFSQVAGDEWEHITYPWIEFIGAVRQNTLIYCITRNRWIWTLYWFNGVELLPIISWKFKNRETEIVSCIKALDFTIIAEWRGKIILGTKDNKVYAYGTTFGGKGMSCILELDAWETLHDIKIVDWDLEVIYYSNRVKKRKVYQDDVAIKKYLSEFEVIYPVTIGNHVIEKEIQDIMVSYLIPSKECSIEVWVCSNHYHFWTFKMNDEIAWISVWDQYTIQGCWGNYRLSFVEKNGKEYTFELQWDLPHQKSNIKRLQSEGWMSFEYSDFNHFRKVGEIKTTGFKEWIERFTNINSSLNLPITHTLQIMIKGKWTVKYSPEIFWVHLLAGQKER